MISGNQFDSYRNMYEDVSWKIFNQEMNNRPDSTKKIYYRYITYFLQDNNYTPDEFYEHVHSILKDEDRRQVQTLKNEIISYYKSLITDKGIAYTTTRNYENAVNAFLDANLLNLPFRLSKSINDLKRTHTEQFKVNGKKRVRVKEIKDIIRHSGEPRNIAVITFLKDSGLRIGDIPRIKVKHIKPVLDNPDLEWYTFKIIPEKNLSQADPIVARVCLGRDSINDIRTWMKYRETKLGIAPDPESYLFCSVYDTENTKLGEQVTSDCLGIAVANIAEKAGYGNVSPHSFRKTHSTNLRLHGLDERFHNIMIGKHGEGTQGDYIQPDDQELLDQYKAHYDAIALEPKQATTKEVENLQNQLNLVQKELQRYRTQSTYLITENGRPLTTQETAKWRQQTYSTEDTAPSQGIDTKIVESDKVEQIAKLMKQGYEIAFENGSKVIMKHQN